MDQESRRVSLKWKIGGTFAGVMLLLGLFVTVTVYQLTKNALRDQLDQRVLLLANTLSDAAAGHIVGGNLLALHALARKYTLLDGVAFAFIENSKGEVIVHTLGAFPAGTPARTSDHGATADLPPGIIIVRQSRVHNRRPHS